MIPIERLLYGIDQKLNKIASLQHQYVSNEDKILILNRAQITLIKSKIIPNQLGFDSFTLRYEDLQDLVVPYEEIGVILQRDSYSFNTEDLANKYFLPVALNVISDKGSCTNRVLNVPRIIKHSDLPILLKNTHFKPSFEYEETLAVISDNKVFIYFDDFTIKSALFSYLRYPKEMSLEGYEDLDGTILPQQDCELADHLEDELLNIAVNELTTIIKS